MAVYRLPFSSIPHLKFYHPHLEDGQLVIPSAIESYTGEKYWTFKSKPNFTCIPKPNPLPFIPAHSDSYHLHKALVIHTILKTHIYI